MVFGTNMKVFLVAAIALPCPIFAAVDRKNRHVLHRSLDDDYFPTYSCSDLNPCLQHNVYRHGRNFRGEHNCKFVHCAPNLQCFELECPTGTIWNQHKKACLYDKENKCANLHQKMSANDLPEDICIIDVSVNVNAIVRGEAQASVAQDPSSGLNVNYGDNQHNSPSKRDVLLSFDLTAFTSNPLLKAELVMVPFSGNPQGTLEFSVSRLYSQTVDATTTMDNHNSNVEKDATCGDFTFDVNTSDFGTEVTVDVTKLVQRRYTDVTLMIDQRFNDCTPGSTSCGITFNSIEQNGGTTGPYLRITTAGVICS